LLQKDRYGVSHSKAQGQKFVILPDFNYTL
jgi:hypothetical protein